MKVLLSETRRMGSATLGSEIAVGSEKAPDLLFGGKGVGNKADLPEAVANLTEGTVSIFSKRGNDFVRISTNAFQADGSRAVGTVLDPNSPAGKAAGAGRAFWGLTEIAGQPYLTNFEPLRNAAGVQIGALAVGFQLSELKRVYVTVRRVKVLDSGFLALMDQYGRLLFSGQQSGASGYRRAHPDRQGEGGRLGGQQAPLRSLGFPDPFRLSHQGHLRGPSP